MANVPTGRVEVYSAADELNSSSNNLRFPAQPTPHSILFIFKTYNYSQGFVRGGFAQLLQGNRGFSNRSSAVGLRSSNSVELPFPKQLVDATSLRMNSFERDMLTEQIANGINNYINTSGSGEKISEIPSAIQRMGADIAGMVGSADGENLSGFVQRVLGTSASDAAQAAAYLLRSRLSGDIQRTINTSTGQAVNPRETLAFEGVNLRTHQFNWDLYPSNQQDSDRIRQIINTFKRRVLPTTESIAGISKAFLNYPSVVETRLIGINREDYMKFKPAMVTNFSVDYGAGGNMSFMKGGRPAGVNLSLQLTELEIETSDDYLTETSRELTLDPNGPGAGR